MSLYGAKVAYILTSKPKLTKISTLNLSLAQSIESVVLIVIEKKLHLDSLEI